MNENQTTETCTACRAPLNGRRDKRFCDDHCRVKHHRTRSHVLGQIDQILHNNRMLIKRYRKAHSGGAFDPVECFVWLRRAGYDFNFHTHVSGQSDGSLAIMCYEEGFVMEGDGVRPLTEQQAWVQQSVAEPNAAWSDWRLLRKRLDGR